MSMEETAVVGWAVWAKPSLEIFRRGGRAGGDRAGEGVADDAEADADIGSGPDGGGEVISFESPSLRCELPSTSASWAIVDTPPAGPTRHCLWPLRWKRALTFLQDVFRRGLLQVCTAEIEFEMCVVK